MIVMRLSVLEFPSWDKLIEVTAIGRVAYHEEDFFSLINPRYEDAKGFLLKMIELGHESVLEHIYFTFNIQDISRWSTHQLVRHRIGSFTQKSLRQYRNIIVDSFVIDKRLKPNMIKAHRDYYSVVVQVYNDAIAAGLDQDNARALLPGSVMSEITWTINLRALRNFIRLRSQPEAHWELNRLTQLIVNHFVEQDMEFLIKDVIV